VAGALEQQPHQATDVLLVFDDEHFSHTHPPSIPDSCTSISRSTHDQAMAKVLIAEPSADVRALLERAIVRLGHEPVVHDSRLPASEDDIDVLLLEPAFNGGLELAHVLRAGRPGLAIVICSIFPPSRQLNQLGAVAHVLKPFQRDTLEHALTAAVAVAAASG